MDKVKLREQAKNLDSVIRIGKGGLNKNVFDEIEKILEKRELIKIKLLNNFPGNKNKSVEKIIESTGAELVAKVGNTISIYKKR